MSDEVDDGSGETAGEAGPERPRGGLSPIVKSSLLWGLVGGLAFLVLVQGYELLADEGVTLGVKFGVASVVGVVAAVSTHLTRRRVHVE